MRKSRFTEEQIVEVLREHEAGVSVAELSRRHGVSEQTVYRWKQKYGGLETSDLGRLKALEAENALHPYHLLRDISSSVAAGQRTVG